MKRKTIIALSLILTICLSLIFSGCYALIKVPDEHYETAQSTLINPKADKEC